jgi:hypothetical protein
MLTIFPMVDMPHNRGHNLNDLEGVIYWFASPKRIIFHVLAWVVRDLFRPLIHLASGILVKRAFGLNSEDPSSSTSQIVLLRRYINSILLSRQELKEAFAILGTHYEMVSVSFVPNIAGRLINHS